MIEYKIDVNLSADKSYSILLGSGYPDKVFVDVPSHVALVSNPTVFNLYGNKIKNILEQSNKQVEVILIPDGEKYKNQESLSSILDAFVQAKMKRDSGVIALGGGVIGDIAGFAASIYMRGISFMQVPTTLLAQVDAAIGGKTAINHPNGKNLIGTFYQPQAVLCDIEMLSSLPDREFNAGLAEVVKYGLLGDVEFFKWLEYEKANIIKRNNETLIQMVHRSVQIKADIVMADEKEAIGTRALLNLGHTFAHGIEASTGYGTWHHGEAVSMGMLMAAHLSAGITCFQAQDIKRISDLLNYFKLPINVQGKLDAQKMLAAMSMDKKHLTNKKQFILMEKIGRAFQSDTVSEEAVIKTLEALL